VQGETGNTATSCWRGLGGFPALRMARIQQAFQQADLERQRRPFAGRPGRSQREGCGDGDADHSFPAVRRPSPTYWLNPKTGVSLSGVNPDADEHAQHDQRAWKNIPVTSSGAETRSCSAAWRTIEADGEQCRCSLTTNVRPVIDIFATPQGARFSGGIRRRHPKADAGDGPRGPERRRRGPARSGHDHGRVPTSSSSSVWRLAFVLNLPADRRQLPVLARSIRDRRSAADLRWPALSWMLFASNTTLSVPALTGAIIVHGRRDRPIASW